MERNHLTFFLRKIVTVEKAVKRNPELSFYLKQIKNELDAINEQVENSTESEREKRRSFNLVCFLFIGRYAIGVRESFPELLELNPDVDWKKFENIADLKYKKPVDDISHIKKEIENLVLPENIKEPSMFFNVWFYLRILNNKRVL